MKNQAAAHLRLILGIGLVAVTISVTPWFSVDPISPIKMMLASGAAMASLGVVIANYRGLVRKQHRLLLGFVSAFVAWMWVVLLVAKGEFHQQIFGIYARNTGFVTYTAFGILLFVSALVSNRESISKLYPYILVAGSASLIYGFIQAVGKDPIKWVNGYSPVIGFLGNPNFQSSFLGVIGSLVFAMALSAKSSIKVRAIYGVYLLVTLYVIGESNSQQGYLVLITGIAVAFVFYVYAKSKTLTIRIP